MRRDRKIVNDIAALLLIAAFYIILAALGIGCPIKYVTGISCAGCGMTRAWLCAAHLDFKAAAEYHPLFWTVPFAAALFIFRKRINPKLYKTLVMTALAAFAAVYVIRLLDAGCTVVSVDIKNGAVFRAIKYALGGIERW